MKKESIILVRSLFLVLPLSSPLPFYSLHLSFLAPCYPPQSTLLCPFPSLCLQRYPCPRSVVRPSAASIATTVATVVSVVAAVAAAAGSGRRRGDGGSRLG